MDNGILAPSLDNLVTALCRDYPRQREAIDGGTADKRVDTEYRYYCFKIFDASAEIVGERLAELFIKEIGNRIGYAKTELYYYSEPYYKKIKLRVKQNIAKRLHLL